MKHAPTTRLSSRGQLVIPKEIRDANGWGEHTEFAIEQRKDGVLLVPQKKKKQGISFLFGCLGPAPHKLTLEELCAPVANYQTRL
jgi:AbrB family looped-hinge helix DNA binding protein